MTTEKTDLLLGDLFLGTPLQLPLHSTPKCCKEKAREEWGVCVCGVSFSLPPKGSPQANPTFYKITSTGQGLVPLSKTLMPVV